MNSSGVVIQCRCNKSIEGNYTLWFALAQCVQLSSLKPHTCQEGSKGIGEAFNSLVEPFFNHPLIKPMNCKPVEAAQLRQQWEQMVKDYEKRNALSDTSAGFETHPVETPYDNQMRTLMEQRKKAFAERNKRKEQEATKQSTMLRFQEAILPNVDEIAVSNNDEFYLNICQDDHSPAPGRSDAITVQSIKPKIRKVPGGKYIPALS